MKTSADPIQLRKSLTGKLKHALTVSKISNTPRGVVRVYSHSQRIAEPFISQI